MKKHSTLHFIMLLLCFHVIAYGSGNPSLKTQYNSPATVWESEALPLGNGFIGAMLFGDVSTDVIQINEHSLWSGGPGKNPSYNGGHLRTPALVRQSLQNVRNALQEKMNNFTAKDATYIDQSGKVISSNYETENATLRTNINGLMGSKDDFGSYQSLCNLNIAYSATMTPEVINITGDCDNPAGGEKFPMLFDHSATTKWFSDQGFKGLPCYIAWEYDVPFRTSAYSLISGNDMPARDPKSWNLYGSTDGKDYTLIDTRTNITFSGRNQSLRFELAQTVSYKYFKFEITATATANTPPQLSEIALENTNAPDSPAYTNYHRELNVDNAVAQVTYTQDAVNYRREYFVSHPDNSLVIRLTSDTPGMLSRTIWLTGPQTKTNIVASADGSITLTGQPADQGANGLKFAQYLKVKTTNGSVSVSGKKLVVTGADEIVIVLSAATNYQQCMDQTFNYFANTDLLEKTTNAVNGTIQKSYESILKAHIDDYHALFNRMALNLEGAANTGNKTTDQLLTGYKNNTNTVAENLYLEQLYYQFGRYLLISSSRPNGLPANLQGIWAEGLTPPWSADYHTNINIQMNYWLAGPTNLSDCHLPVIDYIKSLVPRGRLTANHYYSKPDGSAVRGWVIHHENNIWGNTGPGNWYEGFYFPAAAGWMCQDIWEYYQFTQDKNILESNFPVMLDAALFWVDNLWRDARDGTLVANPSYSPEHGPYSLGASCDQAIITELFDMTIKAYRILHPQQTDSPEITEIVKSKSRLAGPQIGLNGQFMEWKDETTMDITGDGGHRHANHLFWLHPGSQIIPGRSAQENLYAEAMKKTLNTRGDGGTGWSKAWKINFWARLRDGNHSHKLLEEQLKESTLSNLFDTHPPFQIDGNFGATAGMTEMLVQSQGEYIEMLPAIPDKWSTGSFNGIKARGNFALNAQWENKVLRNVEITSLSGKDCKLKYNDINKYTLSEKNGGSVLPTVIDDNSISFPTEAGKTYILSHE
ncbi:MAG: glycoside hydrolase family 95 protein [Paludibacter sp.]